MPGNFLGRIQNFQKVKAQFLGFFFYKFMPLYGVLVEEFHAAVVSCVFWNWICSIHPSLYLLFVPIPFKINDQSSWWSICLMLAFLTKKKSYMTTNKKGWLAPGAPPSKSTTDYLAKLVRLDREELRLLQVLLFEQFFCLPWLEPDELTHQRKTSGKERINTCRP